MVGTLLNAFKELFIGRILWVWRNKRLRHSYFGKIKRFPHFHWAISTHREKHIIKRVVDKLPYHILVRRENSNAIVFPITLWVGVWRWFWDSPYSNDPFRACWVDRSVIICLTMVDCYWEERTCMTSESVNWLNHHIVFSWSLSNLLNIPKLHHTIFRNWSQHLIARAELQISDRIKMMF